MGKGSAAWQPAAASKQTASKNNEFATERFIKTGHMGRNGKAGATRLRRGSRNAPYVPAIQANPNEVIERRATARAARPKGGDRLRARRRACGSSS